jgi:hypothetical protein
VYFTGDFVEAGAADACLPNGTVDTTRGQVLGIIGYSWAKLRELMPAGTRVLGSLGNHDSVPGDVFGGTAGQAWMYRNLSALWAPDLADDAAALATVLQGGWFAARPAAGLTVVSLNINYWCTYANGDGAAALAESQFSWLEEVLAAATARGDAVHMLGHEPPGDAAPREWAQWGGETNGQWAAGWWARFTGLCARYSGTIKGHFYGHVHTDQWTLLRSCANRTGRPEYIETAQIEFCSGGSEPDIMLGDVFGGGYDPMSVKDARAHCPIIPDGWTFERAVAACERVCSNHSACVGFTFYVNYTGGDHRKPHSADGRTHWPVNECCFRTGSVANKPSCPSCSNRCYEKPTTQVCEGRATGLMLPGPALTEGFPAANPVTTRS